MRHALAGALMLVLALVAGDGLADGHWSVQASLGGAFNLPTPLQIRQANHDELRIRARYRTRALEFPLYYAARIERWSGASGWGLDLVHHKLHLVDPPAEIEAFAISHGYNLLTLSRAWSNRDRVHGIGAGVVIAHPENTVRGHRLGEDRGVLGSGYHVTGPTLAALLGRRFARRRGWFASLETRITYSFARVPVAGGEASAPNLALHALVGAGYER